LFAQLSLVVGVLAGCGGPLRHERRPLPLSFGLLGPSALPAAHQQRSKRKRLGRRPSKRRRARVSTRRARPMASKSLRRARSWIKVCAARQLGRTFDSARGRATRQLLTRCLGRRRTRQLLARLPRVGLRRSPRAGDLVVFDHAHDRNRNRLIDDRRSDVGLVLEVRGPQVIFVYLSGTRARRGLLHLRLPQRRWSAGSARPLNSFVRVKRPGDPAKTRYLAGQLLAGFHPPRW
jgi:hypothetical protein